MEECSHLNRELLFSSFWRNLFLNLCSTIHFLMAEVQRSSEWNGHLQPLWGCQATRVCLLCHSSSPQPPLPWARAETPRASPSMRQQSRLAHGCCGVLEIQLLCQPNDTVLPFCELHWELVISCKDLLFSSPITFIKFYKAITYHLNTYHCSTVFLHYFLYWYIAKGPVLNPGW